MAPLGVELKILCPFCHKLGVLEPDIVAAVMSPGTHKLSGLIIRDCGCPRYPRFKINLDHGVWQLAN